MTKDSSTKLQRPWLSGLIDTLLGSRILASSTIPHRNRLSVLLLDSAFETTCRAYLRYVAKIPLDESHKHRDRLVKATKAKLGGIDDIVWEIIEFNYQEIRNDLYHQAPSKTITDDSLLSYREAVEFVIDCAFGVDSSQLVDAAFKKYSTKEIGQSEGEFTYKGFLLSNVSDKVDKLVCAVGELSPHNYNEINDYLKRQGDQMRISSTEFTNIVARHTGSRRFFYYDAEARRWQLSALGRFKFSQITEEARNE